MSNNALKNKSCPPLMSDGRHATDYRPSCYVHDLFIKQNGIKNSHQLRAFFQKNASKIMKVNTSYFQQRNSCNNCTWYHVDPNGNDKYWAAYNKYIGYKH